MTAFIATALIASDWIASEFVQRLGWTLVHSLWQGVVVALMLLLALRFARRASAAARYVIACCAMLSLPLLAIATFTIMHPAPLASRTATSITPGQSELPTAGPPRIASANAMTGTPVSKSRDPETSSQQTLLQEIVLLWFVGVALMALWHIAGWILLQRLRRGPSSDRWHRALEPLCQKLGIRRAIHAIETARIDVPAVVGVLRPIVLVPVGILNDLNARQIDAILAHELAHILRHDYLINLIQAAIETLVFYHPATWWISAQIRRERENCCDDIAAQICGDDRIYASALAALEDRRTLLPAPAATDGDLLNRVRRVLHLPPIQRRRHRVRSLAAAALAVACVFAPVLFAQQSAKPQATSAHDSDAHTLTTSATPTSQPAVLAKEYHFVKIVIGKKTLLYNAKPIDIAGVKKLFDEMPADERKKAVLEVAAAASDVTVDRYFSASAELGELVAQYQLAYLSQTGIHPTTEPDIIDPAAGAGVGEYYISGVKRSGVYSLSGRKITLKQALVAAAGPEADPRDVKLSVIRRANDIEGILLDGVAYDDLMIGKAKDIYLLPNDIIRVLPESPLAAFELTAMRSQRESLLEAIIKAQERYGANSPHVRGLQDSLKELDKRIIVRGGASATQPTTQP